MWNQAITSWKRFEVSGSPTVQAENLNDVCSKLAELLKMDKNEGTNIKRSDGRKDETGSSRYR